MADPVKDPVDERMEALFASGPIVDDGFSLAVERRVRRDLWLSRLLLLGAGLIGASVAFKPLAQLAVSALDWIARMPANASELLDGAFAGSLPLSSSLPLSMLHLSTLGMIGVLLLAQQLTNRSKV